MTAGVDRSRSRTLVKEQWGTRPTRAASTPAEPAREHGITNLLQDGLEEDAPDRKLDQITLALGLLMASLKSPPRK